MKTAHEKRPAPALGTGQTRSDQEVIRNEMVAAAGSPPADVMQRHLVGWDRQFPQITSILNWDFPPPPCSQRYCGVRAVCSSHRVSATPSS